MSESIDRQRAQELPPLEELAKLHRETYGTPQGLMSELPPLAELAQLYYALWEVIAETTLALRKARMERQSAHGAAFTDLTENMREYRVRLVTLLSLKEKMGRGKLGER